MRLFPSKVYICSPIQRGVRVVEGARLESVYTGNCIEGSNPFLSARNIINKVKRCKINDLQRFSFTLVFIPKNQSNNQLFHKIPIKY